MTAKKTLDKMIVAFAAHDVDISRDTLLDALFALGIGDTCGQGCQEGCKETCKSCKTNSRS